MTAPTPDGQLDADDFLFEPHAVCLFQVRDIVYLRAGDRAAHYTELTLTSGRKLRIRKSLARLVPRLPGCFFQIRRGWLINLHHVRDMEPLDRRTVTVTLSTLEEVATSRNQLLALGRERGL